MANQTLPRPAWLRVKLPSGENYRFVRKVIDEHKLHTVCESAHCPNMGECWGAGTATFMILGNICTRSCGFCAVLTGRPTELDWEEPERVAQAVELMQLKHCVITSVNRDELKDGGAEIWARTVEAIKSRMPETTIEVLLPDFKGNWEALYRVLEAKPDVVSHNMETVKRLYRRVRPQAKYERSLEQIRRTKEAGFRTKSGAMLGLGETQQEVLELMEDLLAHGCDVLTLGQYLQPTPAHLPVERFVSPEEFAAYERIGLEMGFDYVESGPLVRSSYHSERHVFPRRGENAAQS
ncbi:MAG: lipoyl synthase [Bacteroidia bacterium]|nr:lipoyl synthase [Bacteroidia bacterium]GIV23602.1 MAG: lipoyl synthase [Bacteroidia bacterium]